MAQRRRSTDRRATNQSLKRLLLPATGQYIAIAGVSTIGGFAQTGALVVLVRLALALTTKSDKIDLKKGSFNVHVSLNELFVIGAALMVLSLLSNLVTSLQASRLAANSLTRLRKEFVDAYTAASYKSQTAIRQGEVQEIGGYAAVKASQATAAVSSIIVSSITLATLLGGALLVNPIVAIALTLSGLLLGRIMRPLSGGTRKQAEILHVEGAHLNDRYLEMVLLSRDSRVYGTDAAMAKRLNDQIHKYSVPYARSVFLQRFVPTFFQYSSFLLLLGGLAVVHGVSGDVSGVGAVVFLLVRSLTYMQALQGGAQTMHDAVPYIRGVFEETDALTPPEHVDASVPLPRLESIEMKGVSFTYAGSDTQALKDVSFTVRRGRCLGIVGPSGGGKSTLVQLLLRLRDREGGEYLVNGNPAESISAKDWQQRVAFVAQEAALLEGTIGENISFLRYADLAEIQRAAKEASLSDLLAESAGLDRQVGVNGAQLSGGQRQRVSIARAVLTRPDLLILDEPTSALDVKSEAAVTETLEAVKGETTIIVVAHRLSTLSVCDDLLVIQNGESTAFGPASEVRVDSSFFD